MPTVASDADAKETSLQAEINSFIYLYIYRVGQVRVGEWLNLKKFCEQKAPQGTVTCSRAKPQKPRRWKSMLQNTLHQRILQGRLSRYSTICECASTFKCGLKNKLN